MSGSDAFTKFLAHFEGTNTSTTLLDSKGHTVTAVGNAQIDTAQFKFGASALHLDGSGDWATITYASDLLIGTAAFGIEFWAMPASTQTQTALFTNRATGADAEYVIRFDTSANRINCQSGGGAVNMNPGVLTNNVWTHVYFGRQGTTHYAAVGGTVTSSATGGGNNYSATTSPRIGGEELGALAAFNGWIDEVRIQIGSCPWTANFTPPTVPYSDNTLTFPSKPLRYFRRTF